MEIKRTKEFYQASRQISDFIKGLPLSTEDNDKLVHNLVEYTNTVERSAALFGVQVGVQLAQGLSRAYSNDHSQIKI